MTSSENLDVCCLLTVTSVLFWDNCQVFVCFGVQESTDFQTLVWRNEQQRRKKFRLWTQTFNLWAVRCLFPVFYSANHSGFQQSSSLSYKDMVDISNFWVRNTYPVTCLNSTFSEKRLIGSCYTNSKAFQSNLSSHHDSNGIVVCLK